jgi:hypothetical protein
MTKTDLEAAIAKLREEVRSQGEIINRVERQLIERIARLEQLAARKPR